MMIETLKQLPRITNEEYHASLQVSKSRLDVINRSPAHYYYQYMSGEYQDETSKALEFGSAVHKYVLEHDDFASEYIAMPANAPKRPTSAQLTAAKPAPATIAAIEWWQAFEIQAAGKKIIDENTVNQLQAIRESVLRHKAARTLLEDGVAESTILFREPETGIDCKVRPDWYSSKNFIVDVKTTTNAAPREFGWSALKYRYHVQSAFYMDAFYHAFDEYPAGFIFVAVEKEPPYAVATYLATPAMLEAGGNAYLRNLQTLRRCLDTGEWPAYGELITDLQFPNQKFTNDEE